MPYRRHLLVALASSRPLAYSLTRLLALWLLLLLEDRTSPTTNVYSVLRERIEDEGRGIGGMQGIKSALSYYNRIMASPSSSYLMVENKKKKEKKKRNEKRRKRKKKETGTLAHVGLSEPDVTPRIDLASIGSTRIERHSRTRRPRCRPRGRSFDIFNVTNLLPLTWNLFHLSTTIFIKRSHVLTEVF